MAAGNGQRAEAWRRRWCLSAPGHAAVRARVTQIGRGAGPAGRARSSRYPPGHSVVEQLAKSGVAQDRVRGVIITAGRVRAAVCRAGDHEPAEREAKVQSLLPVASALTRVPLPGVRSAPHQPGARVGPARAGGRRQRVRRPACPPAGSLRPGSRGRSGSMPSSRANSSTITSNTSSPRSSSSSARAISGRRYTTMRGGPGHGCRPGRRFPVQRSGRVRLDDHLPPDARAARRGPGAWPVPGSSLASGTSPAAAAPHRAGGISSTANSTLARCASHGVRAWLPPAGRGRRNARPGCGAAAHPVGRACRAARGRAGPAA